MAFSQLHDKNWLVEHYVNQNLSFQKIASLIGCSEGAVRKAIRKLEIPSRPANGNGIASGGASHISFEKLHDKIWLNERYTLAGLSLEGVAREIGCTGGAVLKALRRFGIPTRKAKGER